MDKKTRSKSSRTRRRPRQGGFTTSRTRGGRRAGSKGIRNIIDQQVIASKNLKFFDTNLSSSTTTTVGYQDLTALGTGSTSITRTSEVIRVVKMQVRVLLNAANADVFGSSTFFFFVWKQDTAAVTPGASSVIQDPVTDNTTSMRQYYDSRKYRLLKRYDLKYEGTATVPTSESQKWIVFNLRFPGLGHKVQYNPSVLTGYDHLYFGNFGDSSIAPHPAYELTSRIWFYDG